MATIKPLEITCATNGIITDIFGVDKADVVILNGTNYCHLNESGCNWQNQSTLNVLHVKGEKSSEIAGGKNAHFYQLECKAAGAFVATVKSHIQMETPLPTDYTHEVIKPTDPTSNITLTITKTDGTQANKVHIGDILLLQITGPGNNIVVKTGIHIQVHNNSSKYIKYRAACPLDESIAIQKTTKVL
ncbi:unnamed protein product [Mytilus coruscus]|uniref:Uncharacterized protein n=1 Tax=Mytilus coruscus TaxID=42192 RepID=A0A6J8AMS6_MYTCO|nr:unnamed protein product [Mytilus coruscus]